jgi:hypothetical protein
VLTLKQTTMSTLMEDDTKRWSSKRLMCRPLARQRWSYAVDTLLTPAKKKPALGGLFCAPSD